MKTPEILAVGKFSPADLIVSVSESNRKINPVIECKIDEIWNEKVKGAKENGKTCYNGISYRLNYLKKEGSKIVIDFGTIEYKARIGLPSISEYFDLPEEYYRKGCFTGATVRTLDDKYIMVELSGKSMNPHKTDLLGGMIEKPLEIKTSKDIFQSLYNELEEEGSITETDIEQIYLRAIYLTINTNVGFYFEVTLKISAEELIKRFNKKNKDSDIKSLKFFNRADYLEVLKNFNESKKLISEIIVI